MRNNILFSFLLIIGTLFAFWSCGGVGSKGEIQTISLFKQNCSICHGVDGKLGVNGAKDLRLSELGLSGRIELIKKGKGKMLGFENSLTEDQIEALAKYTLTFK